MPNMPGLPGGFNPFGAGDDDSKGAMEYAAEIMAVIQEVVPQEMLADVLSIVLDPAVQNGIAKVQEAVENVQEISFDLVETLPSLVTELRQSYEQAIEGVREASSAVGPEKLAALRSYAPDVATGLAKVVLSRPESAALRGQIGGYLNKFGAMAYEGRPGAGTAAIALTGMQLKQMDRSRLGRAGKALDTALELAFPEPFLTATQTTIAAFAAARGVEYEDELGRWQADAAGKNLLSGAANRLIRAKGLDALPEAERLQLAGNISKALETLFAGVNDEWVTNGATVKSRASAEANAKRLVSAVEKTLDAKVKEATAPSADTPPAPKRGGKRGPGTGGLAA